MRVTGPTLSRRAATNQGIKDSPQLNILEQSLNPEMLDWSYQGIRKNTTVLRLHLARLLLVLVWVRRWLLKRRLASESTWRAITCFGV